MLPPALASPRACALPRGRGGTRGLDRISGRAEFVRGDVRDCRRLAPGRAHRREPWDVLDIVSTPHVANGRNQAMDRRSAVPPISRRPHAREYPPLRRGGVATRTGRSAGALLTSHRAVKRMIAAACRSDIRFGGVLVGNSPHTLRCSLSGACYPRHRQPYVRTPDRCYTPPHPTVPRDHMGEHHERSR